VRIVASLVSKSAAATLRALQTSTLKTVRELDGEQAFETIAQSLLFHLCGLIYETIGRRRLAHILDAALRANDIIEPSRTIGVLRQR